MIQNNILPSILDDRVLGNEEVEKSVQHFMNRMQVYSAGIKEIKTKLEILDDEFKTKFDYNPIHHVDTRLKSPRSILAKAKSKNLDLTYESLQENIFDIAGVRVICNYIDDIYRISDLLTNQDDIKLIRMRDYIKNPKESGYRSLHIIIQIPIFLSESTIKIPVEVQIRTIAMDFWASLEHKLKYKTDDGVSVALRQRLKVCAESIFDIDSEMQMIQKEILSKE